MQYFRIYADDRVSRTSRISTSRSIEPATVRPLWSLIPATGVIFSRSPADQFIDWHPAPVVSSSSRCRPCRGRSQRRRDSQIGPGTVMLADDTTGTGHITRGVGTEPRLSIFVPLADEQ